jgi:hypothetical protein
VQEKKMETPNLLEIGIGEKELVSLKPAEVEIKEVVVENVGEKQIPKLVCSVKHPNKEELIKISSVKYIRNDKVDETGLWIRKDEDGKIQKGGALAILMQKVGAEKPLDLVNKKVMTDTDKKGYLTFKAY